MPKYSERRLACELSKIFTDTVGQNGNYLEPFGRTGSHRAGIRITAWAYTVAWACAFKTACSLRI